MILSNKKNSIIGLILCMFSFSLLAQKKNNGYNYIQSGYYQHIYKADLELLKNNHKKAYKHLKKAETSAPMLNLPMYYETYNYVMLLLEYKQYNKALYYMDQLITNNGYSMDDFSSLKNYTCLQKLPLWDSLFLSMDQKVKAFQSDTAWVLLLDEIGERDQRHRNTQRECFRTLKDIDSIYLSQNKSLCDSLLKEIKMDDDTNYRLFTEILETKGFPLAKDRKLSPIHQSVIGMGMMDFMFHVIDSVRIAFLEPQIISLIKNGDCLPFFYAAMIDRRQLEDHRPYIYGIYENADKHKIYDPKNLDKRRISIGLPPLKIERERQKFFIK